MGGWVGVKAVLRIAYSNQQSVKCSQETIFISFRSGIKFSSQILVYF
jgi:hypothetical protein